MSLFFLKRVLANPVRVGYLVPSSRFLTNQTAGFIDFSADRIVVELGPGEGCHTRKIAQRLGAGSRIILIELDHHFAQHLKKQFAHDSRVSVVNADALALTETLLELGISEPDYIVSGIPFTIMQREIREQLLTRIAASMGPKTRLITYQASLQISDHAHFDLVRSKHCLLNVPPLHVMELRKQPVAQQA